MSMPARADHSTPVDNVVVLPAPTFSCPEFLELERPLIDDFMTCFREALEEMEMCISTLAHHPDDEIINKLFRSMHSIKGNCRMVYLDPFVELTHNLEEIVSALREHQFPYNTAIGDFLLASSDELEDLARELLQKGCADDLRRQQLLQLIQQLKKSPSESAFANACQILRHTDEPSADTSAVTIVVEEPPLEDDLGLMQMLAVQLDGLSIYRRGRAEQVTQLAEALNNELGNPVDPAQLRAAALMHDIGMSLISHNIFNKEGALSREEVRQVQQHVHVGNKLLRRFGGWDEAARIVLTHHERFDGLGYPQRLAGANIPVGARILAIVDTYCSITNERSDRNYRKSVLSAISEINSHSRTQFDPELVGVFNEVIRRLVVRKNES